MLVIELIYLFLLFFVQNSPMYFLLMLIRFQRFRPFKTEIKNRISGNDVFQYVNCYSALPSSPITVLTNFNLLNVANLAIGLPCKIRSLKLPRTILLITLGENCSCEKRKVIIHHEFKLPVTGLISRYHLLSIQTFFTHLISAFRCILG